MSSEMLEQERDGGRKADGETAAELRGGGEPKTASSTGATQREG
jgi:hypothetical protein